MVLHVRAVTRSRGMTLVEIVIAVAILGVLAVPIARFIASLTRGVTKATVQSAGGERLRPAAAALDHDLLEMNQINVSSPTALQFRVDSNRLPTYNPDGDPDGDGVPNLKDPDDDNDLGTLSPPAQAWRYGDDLRDDDDDNDGKIDLQVRYVLANGTLTRDQNFNEGGWGQHVEVVAKDLLTAQSSFTYFGSKNQALGKKIDLGIDGLPGTADPGENDNVIVSTEIDRVLPPTGGGNANGALDTDLERQYIVSLHVVLRLDANHDGKEDGRFETDYDPPLLPLKRSF